MSITSIASNTSARVAAGVLGIAMALSLSFGAVIAPVHAQDASVIAALQAQIAALQAQLAAMAGGSTSSGAGVCPYTWTRDLQQGSTGADVMKLQQYLNTMSDTMVSASGAGSKGMETQTFGPATKAAVMKFQTKNSLTPVAGYFGPKSRAVANAACATAAPTTPGTTPSAGTGLMVSAAAQPANALAVEGAARVPFTNFTLTAGNDGDVTVNSIVVQRTGVINKVAFDGVILLDNMGNIIGSSKTLGSNDQATIGAPTVIPRGTSKTFTVAGNMASSLDSYAGEVGGLQVVAVNTSATVTGSLPISGASHTMNSTLAIGSMTGVTSSFDPNGGTITQPIGTTGYRFAGVQLTAGSAEDVRVRSIRWYQTGSAGATDLANLVINANGTDYPATASSDGKYFSASFGSGIVVAKGFSIDVYIKGDIVGSGAANRTIKFNIDKTTDVYATGEKYGYGITPTASSASDSGSSDTVSGFVSTSSTANPWFDATKITISAGTVTSVSKANEVPAQNIAINVQNQPLGGFVTDFKGEAVNVQSVIFTTSTSTASIGGVITNATIVDENGKVVAGPIDATGSGTTQTLTFTDTITFPTGRHVYTIRGKISSTATGGAVLNLVTTVNSTNWTNAKGDVTGNTITLPGTSITMNSMTVKAGALAITVSATPSAQSIVAGTQGFTFANYQLDATQSGEDVRFSAIPLKLTIGSGAYTDLTNCKLYDGANALNTGSNVINPATANSGSETFTLDGSLTVTKGTVKTITLKCDISSGASSTYKWGMTDTTGTVVTGITSNNSVVESVTSNTGNQMTVAAGALVVSTDSSSPAYKAVPAGSTDVVMGAFKFRPSNEDQILKRVGLRLTNTASSSASDLITVKLFVGSTQIGQATFTGTNVTATSTNVSGSGDMSYTLPRDTDTVVTVKADLADIGTNQPATSGHLIAIDVDTNGATGNKNTSAVGAGSGSTIGASGSTAVSGVRIFKSVPTFTYSTTGAAATNGTNDLLVLSVTADAKGEVKLNKLSFSISTTTASVSALTFTGPNGNVGSSTNVAFTTQTANPGTITVYFDSASNTADAVIGAGQTKTYTLRGTVSLNGTNTTGSIGIALKADTSFPALAASTFMAGTSTLTASNTIWSPSSTTTAGVGSDDFTNGYGLGGCFATSGLGNDCTARVISK